MFETTDIEKRVVNRIMGRLRRAQWIEEERYEVDAMTNGALVGIKNAEGAFIDGHYLASFLASTATIEQILREQLPDDSGYYLFRDIKNEAENQSILSPEAIDRLSQIHELRNSHVHYRGKKGDTDASEGLLDRVHSTNQHPDEILREDSELALRGLYNVVEVAEVDIPDGVLPDDS